MKSIFYKIIAAVIFISGFTNVAHAQFVVSDPAAETLLGTIVGETTSINSQLGIANTQLRLITAATQATARTTANTLTMMKAPTPITGAFNGIEAGGTAEASGDAAEYMPHLSGATSTSAISRQLVAAEELAVTTDEAKGIATGNPAMEQAERQRLIATNLRGEAYADLLMYGRRYVAADTLLPRLSTLDIKQAIVWSAGIQVQILKQLNLLGQSISTNTAAVTESWLQTMKLFFRLSEDHKKTAVLF